ncbi:hypothetical protein LCGC14_1720810 [marine sediment metagenome]|uniref:Uncharacterized protein n=1 Tax=marine sediment metagenome TaxID=412755 RepID=A0A0F9KC89_9ZZZZ
MTKPTFAMDNWWIEETSAGWFRLRGQIYEG